ncbi:hypothetical protein [Streptomyces tauricus]|uniref:hypothetical protein n=1 Tax=Streptomyces tauricus TaxID=68274 RepID=UPI003421FAA3
MGVFRKYPSSKDVARARENLNTDRKTAERDSKARAARFWETYEKRNGKGSVDWS